METAIQEDADLIGLSVLSGAHMTLFRPLVELLAERDAADIVVFGGGIIPDEDIPELEELGVAKVFTPGARPPEITGWVAEHFRRPTPSALDRRLRARRSTLRDLAVTRARRDSGARAGASRPPARQTPKDGATRGPDRVPGEGALRQARRPGHPRHRGHRRPRRPRPRPRQTAAASSSRPRSRPAAAARPAASSSPRTREEAVGKAARDPRHGHQGPHGPPGAGRAGRRHRGGVLLLLPARPGQPQLPLHRLHRGRRGDRGRRARRTPTRSPRSPIDPLAGVDDAKAARDRRGRRLPGRGRRPGRRASSRSCGRSSSRRTPRWSRSTRWSGSATARSRRSTARSRSTTTPTSATPTTRRSRIEDEPTRSRLAAKEKGLNYVKLDGEVGIIGNGAGLVMSTLDVVAYAGEEHGGVKPANFLDIGGGASAEVMADGLDIILGDPQVKACSSTSSAASPPATRSPTASCGALRDARRRGHQAARRPPRRQQRRGGPPDPRRGRTTRW